MNNPKIYEKMKDNINKYKFKTTRKCNFKLMDKIKRLIVLARI